MKFIVDISPKHAEIIQKLLDKGNYSTLAQFLSASIENQIALEEEENTGLTPYANSSKRDYAGFKSDDQSTNTNKLKVSNISAVSTFLPNPEFRELVWSSQEIQENQSWIWGQVNKIFPVKLGVRVLHQMLSINEKVELNEFLEIATKEAVYYGELIRGYETQKRKIRDEKISAALPSKDEKSATRYKFQFLVYPRKDELLDGAMALMRFCNIYTERKIKMIGITEAGFEFSRLINPVLDNQEYEKSLNSEECAFYVNHIKRNVVGEYEAIRWLLKQINDNIVERESLNSAIEKTFGKTWKATSAVINTQRAGLTARCYELGLIEKKKDGIYVKYSISKTAKKLIEN